MSLLVGALLIATLAIAPATGPLGEQDAGSLLPAPRPFQPQISDPMLAPAPRAERELLTWSEAATLLFAHSPDLRSAEAAVERASGRWRQALGALLPNARLSAQLASDLLNPQSPPSSAAAPAGASGRELTDRQMPTSPLGVASGTASQALVDLGAWRGLSSAAASERSAGETLTDVRRRLLLGFARTLVAVVAAERVAELNRLGLSQALERAALTERTKELGAATELDVVRVRQDVEVARGALVSGDEQLRRTREALGSLLGQSQEMGVHRGFELTGWMTEMQQRCAPLTAADERADVRASKAQLEAARAGTEQARAGYWPTLSVSSTASAYTTQVGVGRVGVWSIAGVLSVPLWEGGSREGMVRERVGAERQAQASMVALRRDVDFEMARSRRAVRVAEQLFAAARDSRALAEKTDQLTRRSFEVGRSGSLELVQSAAALRQADVLLATREFELVQARIDALLTEVRCD